jgi:hypothetical protein
MMKKCSYAIFLLLLLSFPTQAATILYNQNFENPFGFVNDGADVNIRKSVNELYGGQPSGFNFAQAYTVETLLVTGTSAFGTGYSDPAGTSGNYVLGMLSSRENDLLGLSFNSAGRRFFNFQVDISSIDLSYWGGPFVVEGDIPKFEFTLFDNPGGTVGLSGNGSILDSEIVQGKASAQSVFDWTRVLVALDASGSSNGNVTLRIDLLEGGYAALDNFLIASSDTPDDLTVPEPTTMLLLSFGLLGIAGVSRKKTR